LDPREAIRKDWRNKLDAKFWLGGKEVKKMVYLIVRKYRHATIT